MTYWSEMMKKYKAAIYLRLSKEDIEENNSIDIQREITTKYAKEHGYNIVQEYIDNGYSGILDSRPALNRLITDITRNKIDMVIVKDMSRFTRDKNLTSYYTDVFFPDNDVRLISVTEYIDTGERYEIDDIVALKGIVNQSYLEDISQKIKAVKTNLKNQGKFIEASVAYGYKKDKLDKTKIVLDENVAYVVKEIFELFINNVEPTEIAKRLNSKHIQTPSQYLKLKNQGKYWTKSAVNRILNNPIYCGKLVLNKYESNINLKKRIANRKSKYKYLENTHEAIIKPEVFEEVQRIKGNITKEDLKEYVYLLKGLVFCKNCGRKMTYKNSKPIRIDKNGKVTGKKNELGYFICTEHYRHKDVCNEWIKIMETDLNKIVLSKISKRLKKLQLGKYANNIMSYKEMINPNLNEAKKVKNEISKRESNFKILYSKRVEEIISEEEFISKYNKYKTEILELKKKLDRLENNKIRHSSKSELNKLVIEFSKTKNFDNYIIKKLVEKIEIGKGGEVKITLKV